MVLYNLPAPQQPWAQAIQQQALYRDMIAKQMAAYGFNQAPPSPAIFGGLQRYSNPLFGEANNTATQLFRPTDPQAGNPLLQATLAQAGQPGDTGISNTLALAQLSGGRF